MRSYRESFSPGGGRRGLTQEALLERMGLVDRNYAERYSHATVSRWESGGTLPTLQRLRVFGKALNLSQTEVAGLVLLAGLANDFQDRVGLRNQRRSRRPWSETGPDARERHCPPYRRTGNGNRPVNP